MFRSVLIAVAMISTATSAQALTSEESQLVFNEFARESGAMVREARPGSSGQIRARIQWDDDYPSASSGDEGITITGGLLRLPSMTADALALILCHELGHERDVVDFHLGRQLDFSGDESRADYFAGRCFARAVNASRVLAGWPLAPSSLSTPATQTCQTVFSDTSDAAICLRHDQAALIFIGFLYREYFLEDYRVAGLEAPGPNRPWQGDQDFLQCRLINIINGFFYAPPIFCKDEV